MRLALSPAALAVLSVACASSSPPAGTRMQDEAREAGPAASRLQCPTGHGDCDGDPGNGCETDLSIDSDNCRACGHACSGAGAMCMDGRCAQPSRRP